MAKTRSTSPVSSPAVNHEMAAAMRAMLLEMLGGQMLEKLGGQIPGVQATQETGVEESPAPIDPLTNRPFITRNTSHAPLNGGTVDDATFPANHPETGKAFKVPPVIRQRFMQSLPKSKTKLALVLEADIPGLDKPVRIELGDLLAHRFNTGNHGLAAQVEADIPAGDGTTYTLKGGVNLMLNDYAPPRK